MEEKIREILLSAFPDARDIEVQGTGGKYWLQIKSRQFLGVRKVKAHQMVYKHLGGLIQTGEIHALEIVAESIENKG